MSWCCAIRLLFCDMQVFSVETVDGNREGQVSSCQWTRRREGLTWRLGPRDQGRIGGRIVDGQHLKMSTRRCTCGDDVDSVLTKSRRWLTNSRQVHEDLVIGRSRMSGHHEIVEEALQIRNSSLVWRFRPQNHKAAGLSGLGLETRRRISGQHVASSESLHEGEAFS